MDSPLSITASITGILTFLFALLATLYVRLTYLRNADSEYFRVKSSLSWYKTESTFMKDLINTPSSYQGEERREKEMYGFVVEELARLEDRLLECFEEAEDGVREGEMGEMGGGKERWTFIPGRFRGRTGIAMAWLPVRGKALELVRQRDALGSRVLFAQMSMLSSKVREGEGKARKREERNRERIARLEDLVRGQGEKMDRLEDLIFRVMHRERVSGFDDVTRPYGDELDLRGGGRGEKRRTGYQNGDAGMQYDNVDVSPPSNHKAQVETRIFPFGSL